MMAFKVGNAVGPGMRGALFGALLLVSGCGATVVGGSDMFSAGRSTTTADEFIGMRDDGLMYPGAGGQTPGYAHPQGGMQPARTPPYPPNNPMMQGGPNGPYPIGSQGAAYTEGGYGMAASAPPASTGGRMPGSGNYYGSYDSNPAMAAMVADSNEPVEDWLAPEGASLRTVLQDWGDRAGWRVAWNTDREYILQAGAMFRGRYHDVAAALLHAYARALPSPYGTFYRGNRVLVVSTIEDENAE